MRAAGLALLAGIAMAVPAEAQDGRAAIDDLFGHIATERALARGEAKHWFGPLGVHADLITDFVASVFADPTFAGYVLAEDGPPPDNDVGAWLAESVAFLGRQALQPAWSIDLLTTVDQLAWLDYMIAYGAWVAAERPESCPILAAGDPMDLAAKALETAYRNTLPEEAVSSHLALLRAGLVALTGGAEPVNVLTIAERDRAEAAYGVALRASPAATVVFAAIENNLDVPSPDICRAMMAAYTVLREMPEPERALALQLSLQGQMRLE